MILLDDACDAVRDRVHGWRIAFDVHRAQQLFFESLAQLLLRQAERRVAVPLVEDERALARDSLDLEFPRFRGQVQCTGFGGAGFLESGGRWCVE